MGSMSASDAAPLPRLGEVFFDVRGESRSMRLSWYADTGVAVFSIWQGGTCTGTFRLPIADLPRMVEALQRGPHGHDDQVAGEQPGSREPRPPAAPGPLPSDLTAEARRLFETLAVDGEASAEELVQRTELSAAIVLAALIELEAAGLASESDGRYGLARRGNS